MSIASQPSDRRQSSRSRRFGTQHHGVRHAVRIQGESRHEVDEGPPGHGPPTACTPTPTPTPRSTMPPAPTTAPDRARSPQPARSAAPRRPVTDRRCRRVGLPGAADHRSGSPGTSSSNCHKMVLDNPGRLISEHVQVHRDDPHGTPREGASSMRAETTTAPAWRDETSPSGSPERLTRQSSRHPPPQPDPSHRPTRQRQAMRAHLGSRTRWPCGREA